MWYINTMEYYLLIKKKVWLQEMILKNNCAELKKAYRHPYLLPLPPPPKKTYCMVPFILSSKKANTSVVTESRSMVVWSEGWDGSERVQKGTRRHLSMISMFSILIERIIPVIHRPHLPNRTLYVQLVVKWLYLNKAV